MAEPRVVATVVRIDGQVFARNADGEVRLLKAGDTLEYRFAFTAGLGVGSYSVALALHAAESHVAQNYEWRDLALMFSVVNLAQSEFVGSAWLPPAVECIR